MVYRLGTVAVTKKQVEEMAVAKMKMLRFAMEVTRKDKIRNEYIRGRTVRNEEERGQAEMVWTCHEERPRVYRKKDDGNGATRKEEKRETRRFLDIVKEDIRKVGVRETDIEKRTVWRNKIRCGYH